MWRLALLALLAAAAAGCGAPPKKAKQAYDPPDERFVLFASGASEVTTSDGYFALGYVAAQLDANPSYHVLVVGHADTSGSTDRNRDLCFKRARAIKKILVSNGVAEARIMLAAPQKLDTSTSALISRRADVYLYDPLQDEASKRLGYDVELRKD